MEAFPAFFPLSGRRVVIAGEGEGAEAKARLLAGSPAIVERVAGVAAMAPEAYAGAALVFVASLDVAFCEAAALAAEGTEPGEDIHADREYRQHLARVLTERALQHQAG